MTKVLIADDEPNIVVSLEFMMKRAGYEVVVARDGPAALAAIRAERPEVRFIRTGNADSNQPMLNINYEMGFRPYRSWTTYMLDVSQALAKIEARHGDTESTEKRQ